MCSGGAGFYLGGDSAGSVELIRAQQPADILIFLVVVVVKANAAALTFDPQNNGWINQTVL